MHMMIDKAHPPSRSLIVFRSLARWLSVHKGPEQGSASLNVEVVFHIVPAGVLKVRDSWWR